MNNWDIAITNRVPLGSEHRFIQFRSESFNAWNHTQFLSVDSGARFDPAGNQVDPNFGAYTGARDGGIIPFSLRLMCQEGPRLQQASCYSEDPSWGLSHERGRRPQWFLH